MTFSFRDAEHRLWTDGTDAYRDLLHADAVMVLPKAAPIVSSDAILKSLKDDERWDDVTFRDVHEAACGATHVYAYQAEATQGEKTYRAACMSVWVDGDDGWRLLTHQQTPIQG